MASKIRIDYFKRLKIAQVQQDVRRLQDSNSALFGAQSWNFLNQFVNILNTGLYTLSSNNKFGPQSLNFQTIIRNPSGASRFTGSLKHLFDLSQEFWNYISSKRPQPYSIPEAIQMATFLRDKIQTSDFPEPSMQDTKSKLINVLNSWLAILK